MRRSHRLSRVRGCGALPFETAHDDDPAEDEEEDLDQSDEEEEDSGPEIRDPVKKIAAMQDHLARLHRRIEERDARIKELEEGAGAPIEALRSSRFETAYLRCVLASGQAIDAETTWDLLNVRGFIDTMNVDDDGEVVGMDKAFTAVLDRYPWLADAGSIPEPKSLPPSGDSARKRKSN